MKNSDVLGIIPARGGSKGVPKKNIKLLGDKPLISWTIQAAKKSNLINRLIVSTDSTEIAGIAQEWGAEIPFMRPVELASDTSPTTDTIKYTLQRLIKDESYKPLAVVLLQPTTPFRSYLDIDKAIKKFFEVDADCVISLSTVPSHYHPKWQIVEDGQKLSLYEGGLVKDIVTRRQNLEETYYRNGEIYVIKPDVVLETNSLYGDNVYPIFTDGKVNIDTIDDFEYAEYLIQNRK